MKTMKRIFLLTGLIIASTALIGCNFFGGTTVSGSAVKGPIGSAEITVYALENDGSLGAVLGTTVSADNGGYTVSIGDYNGPFAVSVEGGSYRDEASDKIVDLAPGQSLVSYISSTEDTASIAVTALTTIAAARASTQASGGLSIAIENANKETAEAFGIDDIDISRVIPADLSNESSRNANGAEQRYGAIQAALSKLLEQESDEAPEALLDLIDDMAADFASGTFNSQDADGNTIEFAISITPEAALTGLATAMDAFLKSEQNRSGLDNLPISIPVLGN
ncbi:hypothetical protein [Spirochaeta dissipatitropha]